MKTQKGFIQIPLLIAIIVGVVVFAGIGYVSYEAGKSKQSTSKDAATDVLLSTATTTKGDVTKPNENSEIEALRKEVDELKKQQSANKAPKLAPQKVSDDLSSLIKKWRPFVAYIECDFRYPDGTFIYTSTGSGLLLGANMILTNRHVFSFADKYAPYVCRIQVPDDYQSISVYGSERESFAEVGNNLDAGAITVNRPTQRMINLEQKQPYPLNCSHPSIGDKVVILGYPAVGSRQDITATEGIISGFDGDYFITSAKVEEGNSGGLAISVKEDCYLGIPTYAKVGNIESLARILDFTAIIRILMGQ